jgi:HPt (histidine-containing phosphotransfer) domain-containing protein
LVAEAVTSTAQLIDRLTEYASERSDEAPRVLHELKGLTRTVGAQELGALSEDAEGLARAGQWEDLLARLPALRAAHGRFADAAKALGDDILGSE